MKNPMTVLSTMIICGAWLGAILPFSYFMALALIIIIAVSYKLLRFKIPIRTIQFLFIFALILVFSTGLFRAQYLRRYNLSCTAPFAHQKVTVFGEVLSVDIKDKTTIIGIYSYRLQHNNIDYKTRTKMDIIMFDSSFDVEIRDIIVAQGKLNLYEPMPFWGEFSSRSYQASKVAFAQIVTSSSMSEIIGSNKKTIDLLLWGDKARKHIIKTVNNYLTGDEGALLKGILIGDKQDFSIELKEAFKKSGMSHIVAVSGLHVGIFIIFISFGIWGFISRRSWRSVLLLSGIFAYTVVVGGQPSILRSALMAAYGILLENIKLRRDSHTALMLSTSVLTIINPYIVHNVGFQLSFLATLGLILLEGKIARYSVANAGIAAFLFTAPVLAYSFNTITFASLFTNILVSPLVIISLLLGYLMCIIPISGVILSHIIFCINHVMIMVSKYFASIKFLTVSVASPSFTVLICCYAAIYLLYQIAIKNYKRARTYFAATIFISLLIFNTFSAITGAKDVKVSFVAVGSGDGIHIRTPNGFNLLVDAGNGPDIYSFMERKNIHKIDAIILTNLKSEDTSGVVYLIKNTPITTIYLPKIDEEIKICVEEKNIKLKYYNQGESISIDDVRFDILTYDKYANTLSNSSSAIKMTCYNTDIMLLGDFDAEHEQNMINTQLKKTLKCDIVRLSNHGKETSNSSELINAMSADYAIAEAGYNSSDRLSDEVYKNLLIAETKTLKTYQLGTIEFTINNNGIKALQTTRIPIEEDL